eukprot:CAMPEP_0115542078 /NCGR_PEP_ID=MMETSP0271-20121206/90805_1 /TAXON_ID=71861 /ORGANISM="Scrippsiella trochoidea, Strain CCMP3099" /LENGTH=429 /DNA_ID=CAMNT_0002975187 /DNA_START=17 /DNA_END=1303 /DNA_ORIENTATION=-
MVLPWVSGGVGAPRASMRIPVWSKLKTHSWPDVEDLVDVLMKLLLDWQSGGHCDGGAGLWLCASSSKQDAVLPEAAPPSPVAAAAPAATAAAAIRRCSIAAEGAATGAHGGLLPAAHVYLGQHARLGRKPPPACRQHRRSPTRVTLGQTIHRSAHHHAISRGSPSNRSELSVQHEVAGVRVLLRQATSAGRLALESKGREQEGIQSLRPALREAEMSAEGLGEEINVARQLLDTLVEVSAARTQLKAVIKEGLHALHVHIGEERALVALISERRLAQQWAPYLREELVTAGTVSEALLQSPGVHATSEESCRSSPRTDDPPLDGDCVVEDDATEEVCASPPTSPSHCLWLAPPSPPPAVGGSAEPEAAPRPPLGIAQRRSRSCSTLAAAAAIPGSASPAVARPLPSERANAPRSAGPGGRRWQQQQQQQ